MRAMNEVIILIVTAQVCNFLFTKIRPQLLHNCNYARDDDYTLVVGGG